MNKADAIRIVHRAVKQYEEELRRHKYLILYGDLSAPAGIEVIFGEKNFFHLTGVELNKDHILRDVKDKTSNPNLVFYQKAYRQKLTPKDFEFRRDGTTVQKLNVLCNAVNIMKNAKMIGDFNGGRPKLQSDKIAGGVKSCVGLVKSGSYYVPNTVLATDTRDEVKLAERVLGILCGDYKEPYSTVSYIAKGIDRKKLLLSVNGQYDIEEKMLHIDEEPIGNTL